MRVLSVGNMYPPHSLGGYEVAWRSAVAHMRDAGHEVRVLTTDYRRPDADGDEDPDVRRELRWYWQDHRFPRYGALGRLRIERHNARVLDRHLDELEPQVVAWWAMGGMSLSMIERVRRRGLAAVGVVCDDWMLYGPRVDGWTRAFRRRPDLAGIAERVSGVPANVDFDRAAEWLFLSATLLERCRLGELRLAGATVAHRGIEPERFPPAPAAEWGWNLAYVGRIDPRKGIASAIEALALLPPEASLRIDGAGDGGHLEELRALAAGRDLGERVSFTDSRTDELAESYARADAILFPVVWDEPWGLVPLEAMAVGRPVVASGRGGSAEYLEDGRNCLLYDVDRGPAALAAAITRLAADPELRARLRAGGFETAARLRASDWNREVERLHLRAAGAGDAG